MFVWMRERFEALVEVVRKAPGVLWRVGGRSVPGVVGLVAMVITVATPEITEALEDVAEVLGQDWGWLTSGVSRLSVRAVTWLGAASAIYSRVMLVPKKLRSVEPIENLGVGWRDPASGGLREVRD